MKVIHANVFTGPSLYALQPVVRFVVDMTGTDGPWQAAMGEDFTNNLQAFLPGLGQAADRGREKEPFIETLRREQALALSHVAARVALELQRSADIDVFFYKGGPTDDPKFHHMEFAYRDSDIGMAAGHKAVAVVTALAERARSRQQGPPPGMDLPKERATFETFARRYSLDIATTAMIEEAERRGIPWFRLSPRKRFVRLGYGVHGHTIYETLTPETPTMASLIVADKSTTTRMLFQSGLPAPKNVVIAQPRQVEAAVEMIGFPLVVKPASGKKGRAVSVGLQTMEEVDAAIREAVKVEPEVLLEAFIEGDDHRLLVVGGEMVAAARRIPGHVVGDGTHTVGELVEIANKDPRRGSGYHTMMNRLEIDTQAETVLARNDMTPESVPAAGQAVFLRRTANISTGGTAIDVTDRVHPDNRQAAIRAARIVGLDVAGIDFLTPDISHSYREVGGAICEVNISPGLRTHWLADPARDVVGPVMDISFPPGHTGRIPIAAITGTNGKTTTCRMVANILERAGHTVGCANADGGYIGGDRLVQEDSAGFTGARMVFINPTVDIAVLETAWRGIIERGLAFDWCDVGAVLNIHDDLVGSDGVHDLDGMARVKELVARVTRGTLVLNADDERCVAMAERTPARRVSYVAATADNPVAGRHAASGGLAVTLRDGGTDGTEIVLHEDKTAVVVNKASDIPTTLEDTVHNAAFAIAIARGLGVSLDDIRTGLRRSDH